MKVIVPKPCLVVRSNGGEISMIERLRLLKSWGVDVSFQIALGEKLREASMKVLEDFNTPLTGDFYEVDGIRCDVKFSREFDHEDLHLQDSTEKFFLQIFDREKPDLVWTHYTDFFATTAALQWDPKLVWVDLTDNEFPRQEKLETIPSVGRHYRNIQRTMVASPFMQRKSRESIPWADTILLLNPIEFLNEKPEARASESWVFVNPTQVKGVDFVLELATALPVEKFTFVGNWISERPRLLPENVKFIPRQKNLKEVLRTAKGLLMPSVWEEAFGRVPLEAMALGVPAIASNRGALPETLGIGGLCLPLQLKTWVDALSQPPQFWNSFIQSGFKRVEQYKQEVDRSYAELKKILLTN